MTGYSSSQLPFGWFQIGWSHELQAGDVRPIHFFDEDLVLCRYESGELGLSSAYCPHMNAHLGHGGTVVGETIACPYHGWRFDRQGCNTLIPYSKRTSKATLRTWPVAEIGRSIILAWYSPAGLEPTYDPPSDADIPGMGANTYCPIGPDTMRRYADRHMQVDFVTENTVDMSHFKFVHETPDFPSLIELDPVDHRFHVRFTLPMKLYSAEGGGSVVDAVTEVTNWGLGLLLARFADGASLVQAQTPINAETCEVMMTMALPRKDISVDAPTGQQQARFKMACRQVENDMLIWTHRQHNGQMHLVAEEISAFKTFNKWKRQFYASPADAALIASTSEPRPGMREVLA